MYIVIFSCPSDSIFWRGVNSEYHQRLPEHGAGDRQNALSLRQKQKLLIFFLKPAHKILYTLQQTISVVDDPVHIADEAVLFSNFIHVHGKFLLNRFYGLGPIEWIKNMNSMATCQTLTLMLQKSDGFRAKTHTETYRIRRVIPLCGRRQG